MLAKAIIDVTLSFFFFFLRKSDGFQLNYVLGVASNDIFFHPCHGNTFYQTKCDFKPGVLVGLKEEEKFS
jgi:hypothetical protein